MSPTFVPDKAKLALQRAPTLMPVLHFGCRVSANFLEISVLEWCKLLGDENDKHF
jgi:hypothetical protein